MTSVPSDHPPIVDDTVSSVDILNGSLFLRGSVADIAGESLLPAYDSIPQSSPSPPSKSSKTMTRSRSPSISTSMSRPDPRSGCCPRTRIRRCHGHANLAFAPRVFGLGAQVSDAELVENAEHAGLGEPGDPQRTHRVERPDAPSAANEHAGVRHIGHHGIGVAVDIETHEVEASSRVEHARSNMREGTSCLDEADRATHAASLMCDERDLWRSRSQHNQVGRDSIVLEEATRLEVSSADCKVEEPAQSERAGLRLLEYMKIAYWPTP